MCTLEGQYSTSEMLQQLPLALTRTYTDGGMNVTLICDECQTLITQPFTLSQLDGPKVRTVPYTSKSHCQV